MGFLGVQSERADDSAVGVQRAGDQAHDGGLARAVRSEQHGDGAAGHLEGETVDREDVAEGPTHPGENDGRRAGIKRHPNMSAQEALEVKG